MVKLPSKALLADPSFSSATQPTRINLTDLNVIGAAGEAMGRAAASIGAGIDNLGNKIGKENDQDAQLEVARAKSHLTTGDIELRSKLEEDKDYTTLDKRYEEGRAKLEAEAAGMIRDGRRRELFQLGVADDGARGRAAVRSTARSLEDNAVRADAEQRINFNLELLGSGKVTESSERARVIQDTQGIIDGLKPRIGALETERLRKSVTETLGVAFEKTLPREEALELLKQYMPPEKDSRAATQNPRAAAQDAPTNDRAAAISKSAANLGVNPRDLAAVISYETGGKFDPDIWGGKGGKYLGLIQFGPSEQKMYGVKPGMTFAEQMVAVESFLKDRGVKPGADMATLYRTINGGSPNVSMQASDGNGTIAQHVEKIAASHYGNADKVLGGAGQQQATASTEPVKTGTPLDFVSQAKRIQMFEQAQGDVLRKRTAESTLLHDEMDRNIIDANAGRVKLMPREAIEQSNMLSDKKNEMLRKWDSAAGDIVKFQKGMEKFQNPNGGSFNHYDKDEREVVNKIYLALGGDSPDPKVRSVALSGTLDRTGILPDSAGLKLRGGLVSTNPQEVQETLQTLTGVHQRNQNALPNATGGKEFEEAVIGFQHDVNARGMSAEQATQKFMKEQTTEYKSDVKARIKTEDVDKLIKDKVSVNDLENAFDDSWFSRDPKVAVSHGDRLKMFGTYAEIVKQRYLEGSGDIDVAKKQAQAELKKVWGVSAVTGSKVVMPYPPEKSPGFADLPNASDVIAKDAIETVKTATGKTVERSQIRIDRMPDGSTEAAFKAGRQTPYLISYTDQNGVLQILNPGKGKAFVPDATAARTAAQEERRVGLEEARIAEERLQSNPISPRSIRRAIGLENAPTTEAPTISAEQQTAIDARNKEKNAAREKLILDGVIVPDKSRMKSSGLTLPDADR